MRSQAFSVGMGNAPTDVTPPKPAPTPTESSAPSSTGGYSPMAAYYSPGAFGLSQVGSAIGDTVSKYATPVFTAVNDTFSGVDDFGRVPGKVRSGDWAGAAKSLGTGAAELGTTLAGGAVLRAGGKGLAFGAGKLGKYIPELETAAETGGRFITGTKQKIAGAGLALSQVFTPVAHTLAEAAPRTASSFSRVMGEAPATVKGAVEGGISTVKEGVKEAAPVIEGTVKKVTSEAGAVKDNIINAAKAVFGDNADAPDQAPSVVKNPYDQQKQAQVDAPAKGELPPGKEPPPGKKPGKKVKPKDLDWEVGPIGGQEGQIAVVN